MNKKIKDFRSRQQIKDEQINDLLAAVENILEEYKSTINKKEKQLSDAKKNLLPAKELFNEVSAGNTELKAFVEKLKEYIVQQQQQQQQQQSNFIKNQEKYFRIKSYKKPKNREEEFESESEIDESESETESEKVFGKKKKKRKIKAPPK